MQSPATSQTPVSEPDGVFLLRMQVASLEGRLRLMAQTKESQATDQKKQYMALMEIMQKERLLYISLDNKHGDLNRQHKTLTDKHWDLIRQNKILTDKYENLVRQHKNLNGHYEDLSRQYNGFVDKYRDPIQQYRVLIDKHELLTRQYNNTVNKCETDSVRHEVVLKSHMAEIVRLRKDCDEKEKVRVMLKNSFDILMDILKRYHEDCSICLSPIATKLACGHIFHSNCISGWIKKSNSCPICRAKV
jgi:hypothetical protein